MKKFIMCCPFQPEGSLKACVYKPSGNSALEYGETRFPVIPMMNAYIDEGESVELIVIESDNKNVPYNKSLLMAELDDIKKKKNAEIKYTRIETKYSETINTQLELYAALIENIHDGDKLYICDTYGTKPTPIIQNMAAAYAEKAMDNVSVECIVYGQKDHVLNNDFIFDITALHYMDNISARLAAQKVSDPAGRIRKILEL